MSLCLALTGTAAAERELVVTQGADLFGKDYQTLKEVELDACESACLADTRCQAFTYNTKARWCFLKESAGEARPFPTAVSGRIVATQAGPTDDAPGPEVRGGHRRHQGRRAGLPPPQLPGGGGDPRQGRGGR